MRERVTSGSPWEDEVGYSRAVRVGDWIEVSGTTAVREGQVVGEGDPYLQARTALAIIGEALEALGGRLSDVVRTRIYVTDVGLWPAVARAHREVFGEVRPAATLVEVARLIDPRLLVEIEATAVVGSRVDEPTVPTLLNHEP
jgi:enamine deaminase RidA (YjgF/YER057c/UK114 family)